MLIRDDKTRRIEDKAETAESVLAPAMTLKGNLRGPYGILIMGTVVGDIESGGRVKIEKGARVQGKIKASDIIVNGVLEGHIETGGQVELGHESHMVGNIRAAKIAIADGCFFQGEIKMGQGEKQPTRFVEKRAAKPTA